MDKQKVLIVLGTAHRMREPGKQSPDGRLKECVFSREVCSEVAAILRGYGYKVEIDYEPLDLPKAMQSSITKQERQNELSMRVNIVNELCRQHGKDNVVYVSIHVDAAGADGKWHTGTGWEASAGVRARDSHGFLAFLIAHYMRLYPHQISPFATA